MQKLALFIMQTQLSYTRQTQKVSLQELQKIGNTIQIYYNTLKM